VVLLGRRSCACPAGCVSVRLCVAVFLVVVADGDFLMVGEREGNSADRMLSIRSPACPWWVVNDAGVASPSSCPRTPQPTVAGVQHFDVGSAVVIKLLCAVTSFDLGRLQWVYCVSVVYQGVGWYLIRCCKSRMSPTCCYLVVDPSDQTLMTQCLLTSVGVARRCGRWLNYCFSPRIR